MERARVDPCVLVKRNGLKLGGLILLQVDDSLGLGSDSFLKEEEHASKIFWCKERTSVKEVPTSFNGITIRKEFGNL